MLCVALLAGCSIGTKVRSAFGGAFPFTVTVAPKANESSAVAVDLIVVYDEPTLEQLKKLSAREWFQDGFKTQFVNAHRSDVDVHGWEWIPNQKVEEQSVSYHSGARKVVLFADYLADGEHRAVIDPQPFHLTLDRLDLVVDGKGTP